MLVLIYYYHFRSFVCFFRASVVWFWFGLVWFVDPPPCRCHFVIFFLHSPCYFLWFWVGVYLPGESVSSLVRSLPCLVSCQSVPPSLPRPTQTTQHHAKTKLTRSLLFVGVGIPCRCRCCRCCLAFLLVSFTTVTVTTDSTVRRRRQCRIEYLVQFFHECFP